ncbi:MAG: Peptidase 2 protein [Candidatus Thermoplasmatota archaeon]|nr:Peptidase 2 protein [Candidatus Thermoplasmatota archaeon]
MSSRGRRVVEVAFSMCVFVVLLSFVPGSALATSLPSDYKIEGVPLYQQIDAKGCGPAALQMIFDYCGEFIDQKEIYNAARAGGTPLPDMVRAGHFSDLSTTAGDRWPEYIVTGYTVRDVGYAAFFFASDTEWTHELKSVIAQGYPVAVLQNFYPDSDDPHYRVVVGYNELKDVFIVNDGWSREFKVPSGYVGSTNPMSNPISWDSDFPGMEMSYDDFIQAWTCTTDKWGWPGLMYGAVMVVPWEVDITAPSTAAPGETVSVGVSVRYPCAGPFGTGPFPTFPASDVSIQLIVRDGNGQPLGVTRVCIGSMLAGGSREATFTVVAPDGPATLSLEAWGTGMVSGHLDVWKDYAAYDYSDMIGGSASWTLEVS